MAQGTVRRLPPLWLELVVICLLGAGLSVAMNMAREEPLPWVADFAALDRREALRRGLETVDANAALTLRGKPGVVFIDARTAGEYAERRVAGAKNLPQEAMYGDLDAATKALGLSPDDRLVIYCGGILCDKSKELGDALRTAGFPYVTVVSDGFDGWLAAGGPTEGGA
ncbi:Rhodanese-like protein [Solidesulfovibrio carbinoliphilus subsp. oakridgensis]|uniref:Rhodanese-like protein n=1 Tax=Solidesulfovibrio carbinoliphilus subsp. oakridgensis TaxID=694327 RepID=G7Q4D0_9BACT|nr:rhodanese-like domain-containing protein [Solidesulfovibrio carbinoliphilus]EHJ46998.1 Rhodanese-like protein [Solidesulfovibrio carbinoliphilus subsp. oakridgensis]